MAFECHWLSVKKVTNVKHHMGSILLQRFRPISIEIPTIKFNTLKPRQNGHHFPDDIFKCIFLNENVWILIKISLEFVPKGLIDNIPALVQIQAWHRSGNNKQLSEPMMVNLLAYIYGTLSLNELTCLLTVFLLSWESGPRLNIKTVLSMYGDFHVKDKTAVRTSYL